MRRRGWDGCVFGCGWILGGGILGGLYISNLRVGGRKGQRKEGLLATRLGARFAIAERNGLPSPEPHSNSICSFSSLFLPVPVPSGSEIIISSVSDRVSMSSQYSIATSSRSPFGRCRFEVKAVVKKGRNREEGEEEDGLLDSSATSIRRRLDLRGAREERSKATSGRL